MSLVEPLVRDLGAWMVSDESSNPLVLSSRVRLARNLRGFPFPGRADPETLGRILATFFDVAGMVPGLKDALLQAELGDLNNIEKQVLVERHLISHEQGTRGEGSGVVVTADQCQSVMINEEDHLRMQVLREGLDLAAGWEVLSRLDREIEDRIEFAFSDRLGYLTACPTNVGTGIRASVMLHLPGLVWTGEMAQVIQAVGKLGLAVRGLYGEGSEAHGNLFQVSNQVTLGESENEIIGHLEKVIHQLLESEQNARERLLEKKRATIYDQAGRAVGTLLHAYVVNSQEMMNLLSALRLGLDMGLVAGLERNLLSELLISTQPAHLQFTAGRALGAARRDQRRARLAREKLRSSGLAFTK
jgi:protein arginine kinase